MQDHHPYRYRRNHHNDNKTPDTHNNILTNGRTVGRRCLRKMDYHCNRCQKTKENNENTIPKISKTSGLQIKFQRNSDTVELMYIERKTGNEQESTERIAREYFILKKGKKFEYNHNYPNYDSYRKLTKEILPNIHNIYSKPVHRILTKKRYEIFCQKNTTRNCIKAFTLGLINISPMNVPPDNSEYEVKVDLVQDELHKFVNNEETKD